MLEPVERVLGHSSVVGDEVKFGHPRPDLLARLKSVSHSPAPADRLLTSSSARGPLRGRSSLCEAVHGLYEKRVGDVSSAVVFVFDDVQGGQRELLRETPGHAER
jgi:hypothetical protein